MRTNRSNLSATFTAALSGPVNAVTTHRMRLLFGILGLCGGFLISNAQASFQLVEDFDSLTLGNINGQNNWVDAGNSGQVTLDPDLGIGNQVLVVNTESGVLYRELSVLQDTSRMLFLRFRFEEHGAYSFGLSPLLSPSEYSDFGPELGMAAATTGDPNNELRAANGSTFNVYDVLELLAPGTWYNLWVMVDAGTDTYQVWLNADPGGAADSADQLDNDTAETVFGFRVTSIADLRNFFIKTGGGASPVDGRFYLDDIYLEDTDALNLNNPAGGVPDKPVAAVLPSSRSVQVGGTATAFASMINAADVDAIGCGISPVAGLPAAFLYQTTDANTNALVGTANTPADIPAGGTQTYLIAFTPSAPIPPTAVQLFFSCSNTGTADVLTGVNTLLLSASSTPVPDIVALAATPSSDGIVNLPGALGANAFAVAAVNVGASDTLTATPNTGNAVLPVALSICQTDPVAGTCLSPAASDVTVSIDAAATPTFGVFVAGTAEVPFDPANSRIFVEFTDGSGVVRGATSVAVRTQ